MARLRCTASQSREVWRRRWLNRSANHATIQQAEVARWYIPRTYRQLEPLAAIPLLGPFERFHIQRQLARHRQLFHRAIDRKHRAVHGLRHSYNHERRAIASPNERRTCRKGNWRVLSLSEARCNRFQANALSAGGVPCSFVPTPPTAASRLSRLRLCGSGFGERDAKTAAQGANVATALMLAKWNVCVVLRQSGHPSLPLIAADIQRQSQSFKRVAVNRRRKRRRFRAGNLQPNGIYGRVVVCGMLGEIGTGDRITVLTCSASVVVQPVVKLC